jgi:AraC-like DNA-binding protein
MRPEPPPELTRTVLFASPALELADVRCRGTCRHRSPEECQAAAQLIFPYRGTFLRHLGARAMLGDANQVLYFSAGQAHQVSHPMQGGDACLVLTLSSAVLEALAPGGVVAEDGAGFRLEHRTLEPLAQLQRARVGRRLVAGDMEDFEAEAQLYALARAALAPRAPPRRKPTRATQQLDERVKLRLAEADASRLSLEQLGAAVGVSPVYLTQVFADLEGVPLYRYQLRLRLARALERLPDCTDVAALALELGFASHSQFATRFRAAYGMTPSAWRKSERR